jgi:hypothetical protein
MEEADLRAYFGSEKELALARAAADQADAEAQAEPSKASASGAGSKKEARKEAKKEAAKEAAKAADPREAAKEKVRAMSVKELKAYLDMHKADRTTCVEKADLLAKALEVAASAPPELPPGPAWMPVGTVCRLCTKPVAKEFGGVICRRVRQDGTVGGCGEAVCWRCMKRAPRESFGSVRTTKEEFQSLEDDAWWMHEGCFEGEDYKDYFGEDAEEETDKGQKVKAPAAERQPVAAWDT